MTTFDDLYGPYHRVVSTPILPPANPLPPAPTATPAVPTPSATPDPFNALLASLLAPKPTTTASGIDFASLLKALRNDPVGEANRTSGLPSYVPGSTSPFLTGFFNKRPQAF